MFAVIKSCGRQFKVTQGQQLDLDLMSFKNEGDVFEINDVLMISGDFVAFNPAGASVKCEVMKHFRGPKLIVFKNRQRHTFRRKNGHRQDYTRVKITEIITK